MKKSALLNDEENVTSDEDDPIDIFKDSLSLPASNSLNTIYTKSATLEEELSSAEDKVESIDNFNIYYK